MHYMLGSVTLIQILGGFCLTLLQKVKGVALISLLNYGLSWHENFLLQSLSKFLSFRSVHRRKGLYFGEENLIFLAFLDS